MRSYTMPVLVLVKFINGPNSFPVSELLQSLLSLSCPYSDLIQTLNISIQGLIWYINLGFHFLKDEVHHGQFGRSAIRYVNQKDPLGGKPHRMQDGLVGEWVGLFWFRQVDRLENLDHLYPSKWLVQHKPINGGKFLNMD